LIVTPKGRERAPSGVSRGLNAMLTVYYITDSRKGGTRRAIAPNYLSWEYGIPGRSRHVGRPVESRDPDPQASLRRSHPKRKAPLDSGLRPNHPWPDPNGASRPMKNDSFCYPEPFGSAQHDIFGATARVSKRGGFLPTSTRLHRGQTQQ